MTVLTFSSWKGPSWENQWIKMVIFSLGLHLLILGLFLNIFPKGGTAKRLDPAYYVDLVSLPGSGPIGNNPKIKEPIPAPSPPPPRAEPKPVLLPKPVPEKSVKIQDQSKTLDQVLEQLKKKVQQEKSLDSTINRLENKVKDEQTLEKALAQIEKKKQLSNGAGSGTGAGGPGNITSSSPGGQDSVGIQFQLYQASIVSLIKRNWGLPDSLRKGSDISADVVVRISRNGRIEDSRFERKSGIAVFDQEVLRTLKKSSPLPPLPEGYPKSSYDLPLTFHSKELSKN
jgi:TonB family protein